LSVATNAQYDLQPMHNNTLSNASTKHRSRPRPDTISFVPLRTRRKAVAPRWWSPLNIRQLAAIV